LLIPVSTCNLLVKLLKAVDGLVMMTVSCGRSQVMFSFTQPGAKGMPSLKVRLVARLIEGTYPDIEAIVPKTSTTVVVLNVAEALAELKLAKPFARDSSNILRLRICPDECEEEVGGCLVLEATAEETGSHAGVLPAVVIGLPTTSIVNLHYLEEVLDHLSTPELVMALTTPDRPLLIQALGNAVTGLDVLMPRSTNR
jgi:DNA polymerase III sliding clamp (beta) subunit (PCNA family)